MTVEALAVVLHLSLGHEGAHDGAHGRAHEVPLRTRQFRRRLDKSPDGPRAAVEGLLQPRVVDHLLQRDEGAHAGLKGRSLEPLDSLNHACQSLEEAPDPADDLIGVGEAGNEPAAVAAAATAATARQPSEERSFAGEIEAAKETSSAAGAAATRSAARGSRSSPEQRRFARKESAAARP